MKKILIFDDRPSLRELLAERLTADGHVTIIIGREEVVIPCIERFEPDLAILGLFARGKILWDLLGTLKCQYPALPVLFLPSFVQWEPSRFDGAEERARTGFPLEAFALRVGALLEEVKGEPDGFAPTLAGDSNQVVLPDPFRPVASASAN